MELLSGAIIGVSALLMGALVIKVSMEFPEVALLFSIFGGMMAGLLLAAGASIYLSIGIVAATVLMIDGIIVGCFVGAELACRILEQESALKRFI